MTPMDAATILDRFRRAGSLLEGHFRLISGLHGSGDLQCALVLQHPREAEMCGAALAKRVRSFSAQVALLPALGGGVISKEIGRVLDDRAIFAERQDGRVMLRHGFTFEAGERVLAVEDVVTTGDSTREAIDVTRAAGALVAGEAAIHRSQRRPPLDGARSGLEHLKGPAAARHAVSRACRSVTSHV